MSECVFCQHARSDHDEAGCGNGSLRRRCECCYVDLPPLPPGASTAAFQERSDRWHELAQTADRLAHELRFNLDRWRPLMQFYKAARQAEIAARLSARTLESSPSSGPSPLSPTRPVVRDVRALSELPLAASAA